MTRLLDRLQSVYAVTGVAALVFGFLASIGLRPGPALTPGAAWAAALLLAAAGAAGGVATVVRGRAVERRRWQTVDDPLLTSGEREYAHKEAERERRWAGLVFFTAPIAGSYWAANQLPNAIESGAVGLLALAPLGAYLVGLVGAHLAARRR